jgi:STE24 endopeptidase
MVARNAFIKVAFISNLLRAVHVRTDPLEKTTTVACSNAVLLTLQQESLARRPGIPSEFGFGRVKRRLDRAEISEVLETSEIWALRGSTMQDAAPSTPGMRTAVGCLAVAFLALFVLNTFVPWPGTQARAERAGFSRLDIERGLQYSQERKLLIWCGFGLNLALLTALVCTSWTRRFVNFCDRLTGRRWLLTLLLVGAAFLLLNELLTLPLGWAGLEQSRTWHMTDRSVPQWLVDHFKGLALYATQGAVVVLGLYGLMHFFPRWWWLPAAAGGTALVIVYAFVMPELILPLFNQFTPLTDPYLRERVRVLARRADVPVDDVLVMDASTRSRHSNAMFVGFGSTRRVVIHDTLLRSHSGVEPVSVAGAVGMLGSGPAGVPWLATSQVLAARTRGNDEVETILAHELGHWRHQHIVKGIALASAALLVGLFLLSRILLWAVGRRPFLLRSPADPAGLPLIMLLLTLGIWLTMPVQNAISRYFERQADASALELARNPAAFIEAEKRLARDNLNNVAPTPFNVWMFSTHPPPAERIEMAKEWQEQQR